MSIELDSKQYLESDKLCKSPGIAQFLEAYWAMSDIPQEGGSSSNVVFFTLKDRRHYLFDPHDHQGMIRFAEKSMQTKDVYFTLTLQDPALNKEVGKERSVEGAVSIFGVWADVDFKSDANSHKAKELPSREEYLKLQADLGLIPTMIINSGNGYHIYLLFKEPYPIRNNIDRAWAAKLCEDFQLWLRNEMNAKSWKLDATADLARILRIPGTLNHKTIPPKLVQIERFKPKIRYDPKELRISLDLLLQAQIETSKQVNNNSTAVPTKSKATKTGNPKQHNAQTTILLDSNTDAELIVGECSWLDHCIKDASTLSEPDWHQMATILVRCKEGAQLFHQWSKPYANYDHEAADEKLRHANSSPGPVTCEFIEGDLGFQGCSDCVHKGTIKSPILLGIKNRLRLTFPDCPADLIISPQYLVNGQGIFTLGSEE